MPSTSLTTDSSIRETVFAVCSLTTLVLFGAGDGVNRPSGPLVPLISEGCTRTPPLAIVEYTDAACRALSESPWPNGIVYCWDVDQSCGLARIPEVSPGKPTPVGLPMPNLCR